MERVTGIGGVFFKSSNPEALYQWYEQHLGIKRNPDGSGVIFQGSDEGMTVWSVFPQTSDYFEPTAAPFMINYRVADLDALLEALRSEGVWIDEKRDNSFGKFGWIRDCDGNRIELWEPAPED